MIVVLLVCLLVGFLVGLAGVGGILVPPVLILMSGLEPHTAMGTALASFIGTGFVGTWLYHKNGHYRFMEAVPFALGSFVCAAPGALVNARIDAGPLVMILAVIIVFAGACTALFSPLINWSSSGFSILTAIFTDLPEISLSISSWISLLTSFH